MHYRQVLSTNSQMLLLNTWPCISMPTEPTVLFMGPVREGIKRWSRVICRLVDPHTNMGSLALAMKVPRVCLCVCVCVPVSPCVP